MLLGEDNKLSKLLSAIQVKHKQYLLALFLGVIIVSTASFVYLRISSNFTTKVSVSQGKDEQLEVKNIETPVSRIDGEKTWRHKMEEDRQKAKEDLQDIKNLIAESMETVATMEKERDIEPLEERIRQLEEIILNKQGGIEGSSEPDAAKPKLEQEISIDRVVFNLDIKKKEVNKSIEESIPAGAFAKAIILGGVDASTTLGAPSDPRPMLVRLLDMGTLPRRFKSDLKDCHIIASSYGDISSERVYARLEKLTCVERETGEIIETEVAGYVAGEDGRVGIRGQVVEKGQKYLANSIAGGVLQGVAGVLTPPQNVVVNPLVGALPQNESASDRFSRGVGAGVASSMDRLSRYYIERAEKLQPVIQVGAGRIVDVVFTEGAEIGTQLIKEKLDARRKGHEEISNVNLTDGFKDYNDKSNKRDE